MARNLEIKVRIRNMRKTLSVVRSLPATYTGTLYQTDTYYFIPHGRLKLREEKNAWPELIFYDRKEDRKERLSDYHKYSVTGNTPVLKRILKKALRVSKVVKKKRMLFMYGDTRIHLDDVAGMGRFLEFEIPVKNMADSRRKLKHLQDKFSFPGTDYINSSYLELKQNSLK